MVSVREDRKASATSSGVSYIKESGRGQKSGQMLGGWKRESQRLIDWRQGMMGFWGGKGSVVRKFYGQG